MTNARTTVWVMAVVLSAVGSPVLGDIYFADGQTHNIDYAINDDVWVDWQAPLMYTTVNMLSGGSTFDLQAYENSIVNILGGAIGDNLYAFERSQVDISGGSIGNHLNAYDSSQVSFSGGSIGFNLLAYNNSHVDMSGGEIGTHLAAVGSSQVDISGGSIRNYLSAYDSSQVSFSGGSIGAELVSDGSAILTIHGSDFAVDGAPFGYGELTSTLGGWWQDEPYRRLTGTLDSGELIGNDFYIGHDAKIALVPAPGALVLGSIGLGFVGWLLKRRTA